MSERVLKVGSSIYLSGPMRGYPNFNYDEFNRIAKLLRSEGYVVDNPAEHYAGDPALTMTDFMRKDLTGVLDADVVVVISGWSASKGSNVEVLLGWTVGKPVYRFEDDTTSDVGYSLVLFDASPNALPYGTSDSLEECSVNVEAEKIINGARRGDYGHPFDDYTRVARMVNGLFSHKFKPGHEFIAEELPLVMECIKLSREVNRPKRDNRVDGAGYWGVKHMIHQERIRRQNKDAQFEKAKVDDGQG